VNIIVTPSRRSPSDIASLFSRYIPECSHPSTDTKQRSIRLANRAYDRHAPDMSLPAQP